MIVRQISSEECIPLRSRVLRPGYPLIACRFPMDESSMHFGVFERDRLVSIVSAHPENCPRFSAKGQWRIRGMATEPELQGRGYGAQALLALVDWARERKIPLLWCNARERAIPFYLRHGFSVESDLFEIETVGPHKVMKLEL